MPLYDLSIPIHPGMIVWPGDPTVAIERRSSIARGDAMNVSGLCLGAHTGTHVDAPHHLVDAGSTIDQIALETFVGKAWVCDLPGRRAIAAADLRAAVPPGVTRLVLHTDNSLLWSLDPDTFHRDFVALTLDAARWLAEPERGIRLVGIDYMSVEAFDSPGNPVHHVLLGAGIVLVEGLNLAPLQSGWYNLHCLPLKVARGDGAPARVVAEGPLEQ